MPISFKERLKRDGLTGKISGIFYKAAQITIAAAYVTHLVYCVRGIVRCASGYKVEPVMSVMIGRWNEESVLEYYGLFWAVVIGVFTLLILAYGVPMIMSNIKVIYRVSRGIWSVYAVYDELSGIRNAVCRAVFVVYFGGGDRQKKVKGKAN